MSKRFASAVAAVALSVTVFTALPASAISTTCTQPNVVQYRTVSTTLSNGVIEGFFCTNAYSGSTFPKIGTARTQYHKHYGDPIAAKNIWEFTNPNGGTSVRRQYSVQYTIKAGGSNTTTWSYSSGVARPNTSDDCMRAGIQAMATNQFFTTRVWCGLDF